jgi:hypothetical protein
MVAACGGSDAGGLFAGDDGGNGGTEAGADGPSGGPDATANDGAPAGEGGGSSEAAADIGAGGDDATSTDGALASDGGDDGASPTPDGSDAAIDAPGPTCPDLSGGYSVTVVEGQGCGDLNASAPQCIRQGTQGVCDILFQSAVPAGVPAINGDPSLQNDGSFANGALTEGTVNRTGCTGSWDSATSTMTVDCGGTGSSQACVLALRRTGSRCN